MRDFLDKFMLLDLFAGHSPYSWEIIVIGKSDFQPFIAVNPSASSGKETERVRRQFFRIDP